MYILLTLLVLRRAMLQHLDTTIDLTTLDADVTTGDEQSSFTFDAIDFSAFGATSVDVNARLRLSDALQVETRVPLPEASVALREIGGGAELVRASFRISVTNNVVIASTTVTISSEEGTGRLLSRLADAESGDPSISGARGAQLPVAPFARSHALVPFLPRF